MKARRAWASRGLWEHFPALWGSNNAAWRLCLLWMWQAECVRLKKLKPFSQVFAGRLLYQLHLLRSIGTVDSRLPWCGFLPFVHGTSTIQSVLVLKAHWKHYLISSKNGGLWMSSIQRPPAQPWIESLIGKHPCTVYRPKPLNPFWQVMEYVICDNLSKQFEQHSLKVDLHVITSIINYISRS